MSDAQHWPWMSMILLVSFFNHEAAAVEPSLTSPRARAAAEAAANDPVRSAAPAPSAPSRLVVKYREGAQAVTPEAAAPQISTTIEAQANAPKVQNVSPGGGNSHVITLDRHLSDQDLQRVIESIRSNPAVQYVEPEQRMHAQQVNGLPVDDELFPKQWHYHASISINLPPAWQRSTGKGVVVAVVDTGVRPHVDLASHLLSGFNFISDPVTANNGHARSAAAEYLPSRNCASASSKSTKASSWLRLSGGCPSANIFACSMSFAASSTPVNALFSAISNLARPRIKNATASDKLLGTDPGAAAAPL